MVSFDFPSAYGEYLGLQTSTWIDCRNGSGCEVGKSWLITVRSSKSRLFATPCGFCESLSRSENSRSRECSATNSANSCEKQRCHQATISRLLGHSFRLMCLEFHHIKEKSFNVSEHLYKKLEHLLTEMEKCTVLCSNCHKKVHAGLLDASCCMLVKTSCYWFCLCNSIGRVTSF